MLAAAAFPISFAQRPYTHGWHVTLAGAVIESGLAKSEEEAISEARRHLTMLQAQDERAMLSDFGLAAL